MKRLTTKLAGAFVLLFIFTTASITVCAQDGSKFDLIYVVDAEGTLKSYLPAADNNVLFRSNIDTGLGGVRQIFSGGDNIVYVVTDDGLLKWYKLPNRARRDTSPEVWETKDLGTGWEQYQQVFAGGGGIIYAMRPNGKLYWFRHSAYLTGGAMDSPGAWEGPKEVGSEWTQFKRIFPGGDGIVYVVAQDNRLKWLRHIEYYNGAKAWEGPKDVGGPGWGTYKQIFSTGGGVIYAVTDDNKLLWQREIDFAHGVKNWEGPIEIKGLNWGDLAHVFALLRETPGRGANVPVQKGGTTNGGVRDTVDEFGKLSDKLPPNEIRCRGYSRFGGSAYVFFNVNSRPSPTGETIVTYEMAYTPGTQAAGLKGEGLRPGECAWADRPIGDNGPFRIRFETVANAQLKQTLHGTPVDTSPTAAESFPDVNTIPRYLKVESYYWSFGGVTNPGRGYFHATGNGYWKPDFTTVRAPARVKLPPTSAPPRPICEVAREARARNSPAAPGLEAQCRAAGEAPAVDVNTLAAKGEAIANEDPLAVELRNQQPDDSARRGFDIGMAAAEGQTAPGPGKDRIRNSLATPEQGGFNTAVSFSLERNRNAKWAATGAAIADGDPGVAEARNTETDVFYRLGFDIASGIFGDPALGAQGNTATGPGSLGIRDSLSAAGQRGFNASVKLHLSRNYKP